jgi:glutathione-regulated potassium-efflux system protein KefB
VDPFRGILLGLFFLAVGMSLDLSVVAANWHTLLFYVLAFKIVKGAGIYIAARLLKSSNREALERAVIMGQGGEFAFVLYSTATAVGILDGEANAILTAIIIFSMVLTPLFILVLRLLLPKEEQAMEGVDVAEGLSGNVLIIGFGRFGQISSQPLLLRGVDISIIDNDIEMIQAAAQFGFKVYYGDGTRLDILHAAGAGRAQAVLICVDKSETILAIATLIKAEFPLVQIYARAYDRGTTIELIKIGVDYQMRETFESAVVFGENTLIGLGVDPQEAADIANDVRRRDAERLDLQLAGGIRAGNDLMKGNAPVPGPLVKPRQTGRALNEETASVLPSAQRMDAN